MTDSDGRARAALDRRVSEHAEAATALSEDLRAHPELGYAEHYAAEHAAAWLRERGLSPRTGLAGPGLRVDLEGAAPGPTVALVGELDAVHLPSHPDAAADGAAPACGHHASLAAACCATLAVADLLPSLAGRLTLLLVPAEEMLPPEHLAAARAAGTTVRATGKAELLRLGELDDVDLALMVHTGREGGPRFSVGDTLRGAVAITATFRGQAAHGGASPELGVDAVRAARQALDALDLVDGAGGLGIAAALRQPTAALGSVPAECHLDVLVRADTVDGLRDGVRAVDDALDTGAAAVGAGLERRTELAYAPTRSSAALDDVVAACATEVVGAQDQARGRALGASTDMGDLSLVMPVTHAYSSGVVGHPHSPSYRVVDSEHAVVEPARYLARAVVDLLADSAAVARTVLSTPPAMTRSEYDALRASFEDLRRTEPPHAPATDRGADR